MADDNWKTRVGIEINFSSEDEENSGDGRKSSEPSENLFSPAPYDSPNSSMEGSHFFADDILNKYSEYGSTPPRTRISRRLRERKQRTDELLGTNGARVSPKVIHSKATRRNTIDSICFAELMDRTETSSPQHQDRSSRNDGSSSKQNGSTSKRSLKLLRGSERDLKLDIPGMVRPSSASEIDDRAESMPVMTPQPAIKVETCNRFMSLTSKLVACRAFKSHHHHQHRLDRVEDDAHDCPGRECRLDFYNTFALLIRMGSGEKQNPRRTISREEHLWQMELKDMIWLELQAWHANRKPVEQDDYLVRAREGIEPLLNEIMKYRFRGSPRDATPSPTHSADSGLTPDLLDETDRLCCAATLAHDPTDVTSHNAHGNLANEEEISKLNTENEPCDTIEPFSPTEKCNNQELSSGEPCSGQEISLGEPCLGQGISSGKSCSNKDLFSGEPCTASQGMERCAKQENCTGCLSMFCHQCSDAQELALKEVEALLSRLEVVEALFPSSKAFAAKYPLYADRTFVARVKAMCSWYNVTKHHRLKLRILGKLLMLSLFQDKSYRWPAVNDEEGSSSGIGTDTSNSDESPYTDLINLSRSSSVEDKQRQLGLLKRTVQFDVIDSSSPSDSNNSNASSHESEIQDRLREIRASISHPTTEKTKNPYRRYIEDVLKTRGLRKALTFLESLHTTILLKSMLTLEKPAEVGTDVVDNNQESLPVSSRSDENEMRRYGFWSAECRALCLPSYRPAFLFLSRIPLDVIHEFLSMRLEQKPDQPSALSIRQLMRELKEGLQISVAHRQRYLDLVRAVLWDTDDATRAVFEAGVQSFDASVGQVTDVYLDYLARWLEMVGGRHGLEEEWCFARRIAGGAKTGDRFCRMASTLLKSVGDFLESSVEQLSNNMDICENVEDPDSSPKHCMLTVCRDLQSLFNVARTRALKAVAFAKTLRKDLEAETASNDDVDEALQQLKLDSVDLCYTVSRVIGSVERICDCREWCDMEDADRAALLSRCREILHQAYKFGFEYHKEAYRLVTGESRELLSRQLVSLAKLWMGFVRERCERGRGLRPRWANQGLDFLMTVCEPSHTAFLTDQEFEELKTAMDGCISHVVGTPPPVDRPPSPLPPSPRPSIEFARSPLPLRKFKSVGHRRTPSGNVILVEDNPVADGNVAETIRVPALALTRHERVLAAVSALDRAMDTHLQSADLIGQVRDVEREDKIHIRLRSVTFGWQRGIKIGQGSYGKVYTAVNNQTGELMAMKEIQLQPNDHRTIRRVAEELRIFEGIKHRHLVRYYGVEIHREEMLIFMEFCAEGTLASLVAGTEGGLPEALIRRYTRQLLQAVAMLHRHGVVHRDVKSANIFLTDEGNCLKLGDFGSAVKIKAHATAPGELQGFVGTQAYMAPEVFMKSTSEGHGRAVDIWSVGCCVVEMASGERPWSEFDSNYQIMFKVGMGEVPAAPDTLSDEGTEFLSLCLRHDPRERATAALLLQHAFTKVDGDEDNMSLPLPL